MTHFPSRALRSEYHLLGGAGGGCSVEEEYARLNDVLVRKVEEEEEEEDSSIRCEWALVLAEPMPRRGDRSRSGRTLGDDFKRGLGGIVRDWSQEQGGDQLTVQFINLRKGLL